MKFFYFQKESSNVDYQGIEWSTSKTGAEAARNRWIRENKADKESTPIVALTEVDPNKKGILSALTQFSAGYRPTGRIYVAPVEEAAAPEAPAETPAEPEAPTEVSDETRADENHTQQG